MKQLLLFLSMTISSVLYAQEDIDTLEYVQTKIIVPEGCSAKSKYEIIDCDGFSAQWLYMTKDMVDKGVGKQLFSQLEQQIEYIKKSQLKFMSRDQVFEGFQYKLKSGTTRIIGLGTIDGQWLILNLGFEDTPRTNKDLSLFEREFIKLE